ncbi:MAG: AAA family ATPase [Bacteroidales bacterium]|nr:AAA family ATPase [Bacteroidales bacterium]
MIQNIKLKILESIGKIYEQSKECKLDSVFFDKVDNELKYLTDYFKVSRNQSFIIAMVFTLNYKGDAVELKDLIEYFGCNPMKLLKYNDDFEVLYSKGILKKRKSSHIIRLTLSNDQFVINEKITEAILNNKPMPVTEREAFKNVIELLEKHYKLGLQRDNNEITTFDLFAQAKELIASNLHFPLIKQIHDFQFNIADTYLYLYLIWKNIIGNDFSYISWAVEGIFDNASERVNYLQNVLSNENKLIKLNLIETVEGEFINETEVKLTDISLKMLQEFGLKLFINKKKKDNIIEPDKIQHKTLFFSKLERKQLDLLKRLLQKDNFKEIQNRLQNKSLPKGITALLHGVPGTGKTETAMQLAKETDREIIKVEISQSKSKWFGESEKIIKRIFTDYKTYAKDCERTPILLFNEADAILSKRRENRSSNVNQTENTIQNIILEELENFEGILIATTNLANNLDSAFERRFLFKIEFQKPCVSIKAKIWNSKLPNLSLMECESLANRFDFSGGQIDNIVRKNEIHEIIHGISVDFNNILDFCKTELLSKNNVVKIGFIKA